MKRAGIIEETNESTLWNSRVLLKVFITRSTTPNDSFYKVIL